MKTFELLCEIDDREFNMGMMIKFLTKELPKEWKLSMTGSSAAIIAKIRPTHTAVIEYDTAVDDYLILYSINGVHVTSKGGVSFENVPVELQKQMSRMVRPRTYVEAQESNKSSPPLIWCAIKYATEVEKKNVWSNISGFEGDWKIRYMYEQIPDMDVNTMRTWGMQVFDQFGDTPHTFEILPSDDDILEMHPDNVGGYEIRDPDKEFSA